MKTYTVVLSGYARHNGVRYKTGDTITGLTEVEVKRLQRARVVTDVIEVAGETDPPAPPDPQVITAEQVLGSKAKDATVLIDQLLDVEVLKAVLEQDERATVKAAAEKRLAELTEGE